MSHLYGAILKPSHTDRFTDWWTSSLQDTLVSRSLPQASEPVKTIHDTSGLGLQTEFDFFGQDFASLKMSKDTSASDSAKSLESWEQSVIRRRGEYSLRVKSARLTSASGSSSWPTATSQDGKQGGITPFQAKGGNHTNLLHVAAIKEEQKNWPTIRASEYKDVGPVGSKSHDHMLGKHYLCAVVTQEAANWPTPCAMEAEKAGLFDKGQMGQSLSAMANRGELGQAAPANPSTLGSRQGSSEENWITPQSGDVTGSTQAAVDMWAQGQRPKTSDQRLRTQVAAMERRQELWPTITAHTPDMESNGPNGHQGTYLAGAVKAEENWVTPRTSGTSTRPNKTTPRQGLTLIEQARANEWRTPTVAEEKNQGTSSQIYLQNQVGAVQKQWATPIQGDSHLASTPEVAQKRIEEGKVTLSRQMAAQWGTPTARDHKSGRGNEEREYKELTPMVERTQSGKLNPRWVETLMGLPVGWTMPSCASPVTIALTNCASSATESSQQQQNELLES